jgi:hypothetical protein
MNGISNQKGVETKANDMEDRIRAFGIGKEEVEKQKRPL